MTNKVAKTAATGQETPAAAAKGGNEPAKYTAEELAVNSRRLFNCPPYMAKAALDKSQKYTVDEAKDLVGKFLNKEVKL